MEWTQQPRVSRVAVYLLAPQVPGTSDAEDEDVESMPSHLSQIEGDEDDVPDTDPATYTLKDVKDEELDMSDCVQKICVVMPLASPET